MSRRREAPPKPEELIQKLDDKFTSFQTDIVTKLEEKKKEINKIQEDAEVSKSGTEEKFTELRECLEKNQGDLRDEFKKIIAEAVEDLQAKVDKKIANISQSVNEEFNSSAGTQDQIQSLLLRVDEISEKMYDFEVNKRNNLIFYGITPEARETPVQLLNKVIAIIRGNMSLKRDINLTNASRMHQGPDVSGCRPVLVTFEDFKDREEVLRKAAKLRGSNIHVTEDMSRRVRESRQELRKFLRDIKRANPAASCTLQYDKLYVDNKCFIWNDVQGKVVEHSPGDGEQERSPSSLSGIISPTKLRRVSGSPMRVMSRSQSYNDELIEKEANKEMLAERDTKIRELEETIKSLSTKLSVLESVKEDSIDKEENEKVIPVEDDDSIIS